MEEEKTNSHRKGTLRNSIPPPLHISVRRQIFCQAYRERASQANQLQSHCSSSTWTSAILPLLLAQQTSNLKPLFYWSNPPPTTKDRPFIFKRALQQNWELQKKAGLRIRSIFGRIRLQQILKSDPDPGSYRY